MYLSKCTFEIFFVSLMFKTKQPTLHLFISINKILSKKKLICILQDNVITILCRLTTFYNCIYCYISTILYFYTYLQKMLKKKNSKLSTKKQKKKIINWSIDNKNNTIIIIFQFKEIKYKNLCATIYLFTFAISKCDIFDPYKIVASPYLEHFD